MPSAFTNPPADSDGTTTPFVLKLVIVVEPCWITTPSVPDMVAGAAWAAPSANRLASKGLTVRREEMCFFMIEVSCVFRCVR
ncbi:MAG: hypothetical protein ACN6O3_18025 [Comamonas sp.]